MIDLPENLHRSPDRYGFWYEFFVRIVRPGTWHDKNYEEFKKSWVRPGFRKNEKYSHRTNGPEEYENLIIFLFHGTKFDK